MSESGRFVSVVKVVYNAKESLEATIASVLNQSYPHVEYIIIDGGSQDGTVELITRYRDRLAYWTSEPDRGIYDAMNKGVAAAKGDWIIFINAGDEFYCASTLEILSSDLAVNKDIVYGDVVIKYEDFRIVKRSGELRNIWRGMQFCHQSSAVRLKRLQHMPFNIDNPIAADLEWFIRAYDSGYVFLRHNQIISTVSAGGISDADQYQAVTSIEKAVRSVRHESWLGLYFFSVKMLVCLKKLIKIMTPKFVLKQIRIMAE